MATLKRRLRRWNGTSYDTVYFETDASVITGTLPVNHGGTGRTTMSYKNAVPIGNASTVTAAMQAVRTASGAFYSTGQDAVPKFGTLPVAQGGTGSTTAADARTALGAAASDHTHSEYAASSHTHAAGNITSGSLAVARGGTGRSNVHVNGILVGNATPDTDGGSTTTSGFQSVQSKTGAFYSTGTNIKPAFGTLPIAQGGTGATTAAAALINLGCPVLKIGSKKGNVNTSSQYVSGSVNLGGPPRILILTPEVGVPSYMTNGLGSGPYLVVCNATYFTVDVERSLVNTDDAGYVTFTPTGFNFRGRLNTTEDRFFSLRDNTARTFYYIAIL